MNPTESNLKKRSRQKHKCVITNCVGCNTYHRFPANPHRRVIWLQKIGKTPQDDPIYKNKRICDKHFDNNALRKTRIPAHFLNLSEQAIQTQKRKEAIKLDHCYAYTFPEEHASMVNKIDKVNANLGNEDIFLRKMADVNQITNMIHFLNFYTSFSDRRRYDKFVEMMLQRAHVYSQQSNESPDDSVLDLKTQIFLTLTRLRVGLPEAELGVRYGVSETTVSKIFKFWLQIMCWCLSEISFWESWSAIYKKLPDEFRRRYPRIRVILDSIEIFIEDCTVPATYSPNKKCNTVKGLVGISPNGFISFVSKLYPGGISDTKMMVDSGIVKKLQSEKSLGMADRGFRIQREVEAEYIRLIVPQLQQSCEADEKLAKDIASIRIRVERSIREIKLFRILQRTVPNDLSDQLPLIWRVCCLLTNISRVPLLNIK